ncbi:MAG: hypothetical protein HUJ26_00815, partial [Planctomycetaceae bacterium]|nr:hypothetical protein [Planctomycetaceae bacterium]
MPSGRAQPPLQGSADLPAGQIQDFTPHSGPGGTVSQFQTEPGGSGLAQNRMQQQTNQQVGGQNAGAGFVLNSTTIGNLGQEPKGAAHSTPISSQVILSDEEQLRLLQQELNLQTCNQRLSHLKQKAVFQNPMAHQYIRMMEMMNESAEIAAVESNDVETYKRFSQKMTQLTEQLESSPKVRFESEYRNFIKVWVFTGREFAEMSNKICKERTTAANDLNQAEQNYEKVQQELQFLEGQLGGKSGGVNNPQNQPESGQEYSLKKKEFERAKNYLEMTQNELNQANYNYDLIQFLSLLHI